MEKGGAIKTEPWWEGLKLKWPCASWGSMSSRLGVCPPSRCLPEELWTPAAHGPLHSTLGSWRPLREQGSSPTHAGEKGWIQHHIHQLRCTLPEATMPERWPSKGPGSPCSPHCPAPGLPSQDRQLTPDRQKPDCLPGVLLP